MHCSEEDFSERCKFLSPKGGTAAKPSNPPSRIIAIKRPSLGLVNPRLGKPVTNKEAGIDAKKCLHPFIPPIYP